MKTIQTIISAVLLATLTMAAQAENPRDCMLEGSVHRSDSADGQDSVKVRFHSASKYEEGATCRMRRGEKLEFRLPDDPRLQDAPEGSKVKARYQRNSEGESTTELISVGTAA